MEDWKLDTKRGVHEAPVRSSTLGPCSRSVGILCVLLLFVLYHVGEPESKFVGGRLRTLGDVNVISWVAVKGR